jgi:hypothetical protein
VASALAAGCLVVAVPCEVALIPSDGVVQIDSLEMLDLATLQGLRARGAAA